MRRLKFLSLLCALALILLVYCWIVGYALDSYLDFCMQDPEKSYANRCLHEFVVRYHIVIPANNPWIYKSSQRESSRDHDHEYRSVI